MKAKGEGLEGGRGTKETLEQGPCTLLLFASLAHLCQHLISVASFAGGLWQIALPL